MRGFVLITLGFLAISLIACAGAPPIASSPSSPGSAIEYSRTGGFAGLNDQLTIDSKGHAVLIRRNGKAEFDLNDSNLKGLYAAFQVAGFATIPENSMPIGLPADAFNYTIAYQGHTVRTADSAVPKALEPVLQLLNQMVDTRGK